MARSTAAAFGRLIRDRRRELDLTQEQVANSVGTSTPYVGHLESGKRHPSEAVVTRLASVLNLNPRELFFLANPGAMALVNPPAQSERSSAWEEFQRDARLRDSYRITEREMEVLSRVALMGQVRSSRDFIYVLNTVRQALVH